MRVSSHRHDRVHIRPGSSTSTPYVWCRSASMSCQWVRICAHEIRDPALCSRTSGGNSYHS